MKIFYVSINMIDLAILFILAIQTGMNYILNLNRKRLFLFSIELVALVLIAEIVTSIFESTVSKYWILSLIANMIGFSVSPFIPLVLSMAFGTRLSRLENCMWLPSVINAVMVLISPIYRLTFSVTRENIYSRGPLFIVFGIACVCSLLGFIISVIRTTRKQEKAQRLILYCIMAYIFISNSVQVIWPQLHLTWTCNTVGLLFLYGFYNEQSSRYDTVTEFLNRKAYEIELTQIKKKSHVAVVMFDVDNFKYVNDNYGHAFGDYCLNKLAEIISDVFTDSGNCYRIGGDEFCYLSDKVDDDFIKDKLDELIIKISSLRNKDERIPMVSFGYSFYYKLVGDRLEDVLIKADEQAYKYKIRRRAVQ